MIYQITRSGDNGARNDQMRGMMPGQATRMPQDAVQPPHGAAPDDQTHCQRVVARIRADILRGIWRPDARLKVRDLAARYGVSPAPIREGLQQLQGEGLVVMEPQRGARVRRVDEQLVINIFDVREAL